MAQGGLKLSSEVVALIPAAGQATRLGPLPCSKEMLPIGSVSPGPGRRSRAKAVCEYLLESMRAADITKAHLILRAGKWDIPAYLGDGSNFGIHLSYLLMRLSFGVPYTLDQAFPFVRHSIVALGFPDIIFEPRDAFARVLDCLAATRADVVLGLFPADQPENTDMVECEESGRVRSLIIKQRNTMLRYGWVIAVWTPEFTRFLHSYVAMDSDRATQNPGVGGDLETRELFVGDVIQAAINSGIHVHGLVIPDGEFLDIGTPGNLEEARRRYQ